MSDDYHYKNNNDNAVAAAAGGGGDACYEPRRSNRVEAGIAESDGDTWHERIAICEGATVDGKPRLMVRSYFRNRRTKERVWDEPPTGASNIVFASAEERGTANGKLNELRTTLEMIPPEAEGGDGSVIPTTATAEEEGATTTERKGFLGRFRKKKDNVGGRHNKNPKSRQRRSDADLDVAQDLNLQRAIARSMIETCASDGFGTTSGGDVPVVFFDPDSNTDIPPWSARTAGRSAAAARNKNDAAVQDDDDLAMAKALSMSEAVNNCQQLSEEEMLQLAIAESQKEAELWGGNISNTAAIVGTTGNASSDLLGLGADGGGNGDAEDDRKMPARIEPTRSFDPYAPGDAADADATAAEKQQSTCEVPPPVGDLQPATGVAASTSSNSGTERKKKKAAGGNRIGSKIFGGGRKAMAEEAGVV